MDMLDQVKKIDSFLENKTLAKNPVNFNQPGFDQMNHNQLHHNQLHQNQMNQNQMNRNLMNLNQMRLDQIREDNEFIDKMLNMVNLQQHGVTDEQQSRLGVIKSRNLSYILLNEKKTGGDSPEMHRVKESVANLENTMRDGERINYENIQNAYRLAIANCQHYCNNKNPKFATGKERKRQVAETLERLRQEAARIELAIGLISQNQTNGFNIKNPQDLLVLSQLNISQNDAQLEEVKEFEKESKDITGAGALTLEDFARLLGTHNRGEFELKDGKLSIKNNSHFRSTGVGSNLAMITGSDEHATIANQKMKEQLYRLAKELTGNDKEALKEIDKYLGVEKGGKKSLAMERTDLAKVMAQIYSSTSKVEKALKKSEIKRGDYNSEEEYRNALAKAADDLELAKASQKLFEFGTEGKDKESNAEMIYGRVKKGSKYQSIKKDKKVKEGYYKKLNQILKKGRKAGVKIPTLSTHMVDNIVDHNMSLIRERIFESLGKIAEYAKNLRGGRDIDVHRITENQELIDRVAGAVVADYVADSELMKETAGRQLEEIIRAAAFSSIDQNSQQLAVDSDKLDIRMLSVGGADGLDREIEKRLPVNKAWKGKSHSVKSGADSLSLLCESLSTISKLKDTGLKEGLTPEEAQRLRDAGRQIQTLFTDDFVKDMELVVKELKGTRFEQGYKEAKALIKGKFSFEDAAGHLADAMKNEQKQAKQALKAQVAVDEDEMLSVLNEKTVAIHSILTLINSPTSLVKKPMDENAKGLKTLSNVLRTFPEAGKTFVRTVKLAGEEIRLVQKTDGNLYMYAGKQLLPLRRNARQIANAVDEDILKNSEMFDRNTVQGLISGIPFSEENNGLLVKSRNMYIKYLAGRTKKPDTFFTNLSTVMLKEYTEAVFNGTLPPERLVNTVSDIDSKICINGSEVLELLEGAEKNKVLNVVTREEEEALKRAEEEERLREKIRQEAEQKKEKNKEKYGSFFGAFVNLFDSEEEVQEPAPQKEEKKVVAPDEWSPEEAMVRDLIADMVYSANTWKYDATKQKPGERMKLMLKDNFGAIKAIAARPELILDVAKRLPVEDDMIQQLAAKLDEFLAMEDIKLLLAGSKALSMLSNDMWEEKVRDIIDDEDNQGRILELEKAMDDLADSAVGYVQEIVEKEVNEAFKADSQSQALPEVFDPNGPYVYTTQELEAMEELEKQLKGADLSPSQRESRQSYYNELKNKKKPSKEDKKRMIKDSAKTLDTIIENAAKGGEGQALFIKNVMSRYFTGVSAIDKRAMLASAIRNAKPRSKDGHTTIEEQQGQIFGGLLKGAGPLLQKILQGMPEMNLPKYFTDALADMKSNLAPIPMEIVKAELQGIVDRSEGKVTKISISRALGAASVGQAFFCKLFGPGLPEDGKEVVVKLLRPDVKNRMMREKEIMLQCARETDKAGGQVQEGQIGGMEATYLGQLARIEEELDLTLEAKNAQKGSVYDKGYKTVKAMKLETLVEPTSNVMVLEKAEGDTVDGYMKDIAAKQDKLMAPIFQKNEDGSYARKGDLLVMSPLGADNINQLAEAKRELAAMLEELKKRQEYLVQFGENWVAEGLFGGGFYHGDLHAGNIMISDKGVTVIDFGNATSLDDEQLKHVTRMMIAASIGSADIFLEGFRSLLENTSPEKYKAAEPQLKDIFKRILSQGDANSTGQRIMAALLKAQTLGFELPSAIWNFSQSQIRLDNTITSVNNQIRLLQESLNALVGRGAFNTEKKDGFDSYINYVSAVGFRDKIDDVRDEMDFTDEKAQKMRESLDRDLSDNDFRKLEESMKIPSTDFTLKFDSVINGLKKAVQAQGDNKENGKEEKLKTLEKYSCNKTFINSLESFAPADAVDRVRKTINSKCIEGGESLQIAIDELEKLRSYGPGFKMLQKYGEFNAEYSDYKKKAKEGEAEPENVKKLKDEFYQAYCEYMKFKETHNGYIKENFREALLDENKTEDVNRMMDSYCSDQQLSEELRNEFRADYEELRKQQKDNPEGVKAALDKFIDTYRRISIVRLGNVKETFSIQYDKSKPEDFVTTISQVINSNIKSSLSRFGMWNIFMNRSKLMEMQN